MYLPILPPITFSPISQKNIPGFPFDKHAYWIASARAGIIQLLASLGVPANAEVLVPAYMCSEVVSAFQQMGYSVGYYNVPLNLQCSVADIKPHVTSKSKAILITHYFGFPQKGISELVEFAHRMGLVVIEDCAHTLPGMSWGGRLGTFGDGAVFSLRKMLGVPYSGIAWAKKENAPKTIPNTEIRKNSTARSLLGLVIESFAVKTGVSPENFKKPLRNLLKKNKTKDTVIEDDALNQTWLRTIDIKHLKCLINHVNLIEVHKIRLRNYNLLYNLIQKSRFRPVFPGITKDWCPFAFPIWVEGNRQKDLQRRLWATGIGAATWPRLPEEIDGDNFCDAITLKSHILLLPIHQGISATNIRKMVQILLSLR